MPPGASKPATYRVKTIRWPRNPLTSQRNVRKNAASFFRRTILSSYNNRFNSTIFCTWGMSFHDRFSFFLSPFFFFLTRCYNLLFLKVRSILFLFLSSEEKTRENRELTLIEANFLSLFLSRYQRNRPISKIIIIIIPFFIR